MNKKEKELFSQIEALLASGKSKEDVEGIFSTMYGAGSVSTIQKYFKNLEAIEKKEFFEWPITSGPPTFIPSSNAYSNFEYLMNKWEYQFGKLYDNVLIKTPTSNRWEEFTEDQRRDLHAAISNCEFDCSRENQRDFVYKMAKDSGLDWMNNYLNKAKWDGIDRIKQLYDCLDSQSKDDLEYIGFKKFIHGYVSLALGLDFKGSDPRSEIVLILSGTEGTGKTAWCRKLVPEAPIQLFHEGHIDTNNKDHNIKKGKILLWVASEIDSCLRKNDIASFKDFVTSTYSKERRAYGVQDEEVKKICSFIGSTNDKYFLSPSGENRRFLIIDTGKINYKFTIDLQQLFVQVKEERSNGFINWFTREEIEQNRKRCERWYKSDGISEFMSDLTRTEGFLISEETLWMKYVDYCKAGSYPQSTKSNWKQRLEERGYSGIYNAKERKKMWNADLVNRFK